MFEHKEEKRDPIKVGLEIVQMNLKYMLMSQYQTARQNDNIRIDIKYSSHFTLCTH